ncbi:peptidylprolyl isomerase [Elioraea sp.]|uniref:peptidylprolyl isomerase n=1 Tax=Elioraea sp. TaxID=2185103 RepID=UPI0025B9C3AE|nr:peptidylprolyl isomerase [Elioraea sp.]
MRLTLAPGLLAVLLAAPVATPVAAWPWPAAQAVLPQATPAPAAPMVQMAQAPGAGIVAIVNGEVITLFDLESRRRLFAITAGLPLSPAVLDRITPQVRRLLIDEKLRQQEALRRRVGVTDREIADAVARLEAQNGMSAGGLRASLARQGIDIRALYSQIRAQLGWAKLVRAQLGQQAQITEDEVRERMRASEAATGQPEFLVGEVFIAIDDASQEAEAQRTASSLIDQLRAGAPFPAVAAQFSQAQSGEEGGDLGWVRLGQLEPEVEAVVTQMPPGAVSNPIRTAGGLTIVTLRQRREVGRDMATLLSIRQVFLPFDQPLNPQAPTQQQIVQLQNAQRIGETVKSCSAMEEAARQLRSSRPADPGQELRLEQQQGPIRAILDELRPGVPTRPLIAPDGIAVLILCSRRTENLAVLNPQAIAAGIQRERADLLSRQMMRDLRRRADIDVRS